jgi:hypothetical protein
MREQILAEIKRLAKERGAAPGKRVFENATGIKEHNWRGIYWAKWNDVLSDAGLLGNEMTTAYSIEAMMDPIVDACRYYGRFPTTAELMLYGQGKPSFPSEKTIRNRFPRRAELITALAAYAQERSSLADVGLLLPKVEKMSAPRETKVAEGVVYLLKSGSHYKIGRSDQIERRVKEIRITLPESVELVHSIRTDDPSGIEAYWHRRFAHLRANGEWFKLGAPEVAAFRKRKYQ